MSSGDTGVLRKEAGQEGPRMPAWKRELLERRKAKGGGSGPGADSGSGSGSSRVNGEQTGTRRDDVDAGAHSNRTYTITPAAKRSGTGGGSPVMSPVKTKDPWSAMDTGDTATSVVRSGSDNGESLVLQESLGPIKENPFIKLEKERRKRLERENASRPVQHILELYGGVPGVRTIRAENIIIIESDPDYFSDGGAFNQTSMARQNGTISEYSSLNDLLDRRGNPVTEIRAKEVVIYDTALSKSEENLSTLGRGELADLAQAQGTVSRMREKFDIKYGVLHSKSRSSENLLDLSSGTRTRPRYPDVVPKRVPGSPVRLPHYSQPVFYSSQSSPKRSPNGSESSSPVSGSPLLTPSYQRRSVSVNPREDVQSKPVRERDRDSPDGASKAKVPCSPENHYASTSPSGLPGFEIRPSPRPELSTIPANDTQARALANLRLQSRNSFTVIPKQRRAPSAPGSTAPSSPIVSPAHSVPSVEVPALSPSSSLSSEDQAPAKMEEIPPEKPGSPILPISPTLPNDHSISSPDVATDSTPPPAPEPALEKLPVTNIDDIVVGSSQTFPSPMMQRRKGNTFTVVPKRRTEPQPVTPDVQEPAPEPQGSPSSSAQSSPSSGQAPYSHLGTLLKKRYPAVEEIEVIGGYLSLGRSCLSKTGSTGKKLKISFNESSLHSTFEYPSESSVWDSGEEEEEGPGDGGGGAGKEEGEIGLEAMRIPRPSYTSSPTNHSPDSSDLSNYTPKHSVEFTAWQEQKVNDPSHLNDANDQPGISEEVMLTPADSSSLSDFSSEPALYF
ncbi:taperin [Trichomycterus rosablanca]|uniref:taperin n=1 Tax=Trichomycterus rosablanca TaxID=2290929 RepID=UPI002F35E4AB